MDITIEPECPDDQAEIHAVVRAAFDHHQGVADMVDAIRVSPNFVPDASLVARLDGEVVGHVMLSYVTLVDGEVRHRVLSLSPLAVAPAVQRRGVGSALVPAALAVGEARGEPLVVLEGSPVYYGRFGFVDSRPLGITLDLPDGAPREAGQVYRLTAYDPTVRGHLVYPPAFALADG
ncbi:GNAT family N-acetyltransferase [Angustibacter luteus]|uniref:GNAT family N-acetyltransferase n=1 Tax=Angustibacter luteus TaxID=658456 RepID=A0ABW1JC54_9ACTN